MLKVAALFSLKRARQRRKSIFGDIRSETASTLRDSSSLLQSSFVSAQSAGRFESASLMRRHRTSAQKQKQEIEKVFFFRGERERAELTLLSPAHFLAVWPFS